MHEALNSIPALKEKKKKAKLQVLAKTLSVVTAQSNCSDETENIFRCKTSGLDFCTKNPFALGCTYLMVYPLCLYRALQVVM